MADSDRFGALKFAEKQMIYQGLLSLVETNSGIGFANNDQGHPAYALGRNGTINHDEWGDSPDANLLFQMMVSLLSRRPREPRLMTRFL